MPARSKPQRALTAVIHGSILRTILDVARVAPADELALLQAVGLTPANLQGEEAIIPLKSYMVAFDALAAQRRQPLLGLQIAEKMGPGLLGAVGYLFLAAPTLRAAILTFVEGSFSVQGASHLILREGSDACLTYAILDESLGPRRQDVEFSLGYLAALIWRYLGKDFRPIEVHFEHKPDSPLQNYEEIFRCPVFFEQPANQLVLTCADLDRSSTAADDRIASLLRHYLSLLADQQNAVITLGQRVDLILGRMLHDPDLKIASVASALSISEHGLRRGLRAEGTSFRSLLRAKRIAAAKRLMLGGEGSLLNVAHRVGYGDASAFTHAFAAETGLAPRAWREAQGMGGVTDPASEPD